MNLIVTVADGPEYDGGVYVLVRLLRWLGCTLPVQSWFAASRPNDPMVRVDLEKRGTTFHTLPDGVEGFHAKCFPAIWPTLQNSSDEVLYLDSDSYPTRNPEEVFSWREYTETGALFWPNFRSSDPARWAKLDMTSPAEPEFETGQYAVNTSRVGLAMKRGHDYCNDPTVFGPIFRDDQECLHAGFVRTGTPYAMVGVLPKFELHTVINHDPRGRVFTQHRVADKFRLQNWPCFWTKQRGDQMVRHSTLSDEDVLFGFFEEFANLISGNLKRHVGQLPGFSWCSKCRNRACMCKKPTHDRRSPDSPLA